MKPITSPRVPLVSPAKGGGIVSGGPKMSKLGSPFSRVAALCFPHMPVVLVPVRCLKERGPKAEGQFGPQGLKRSGKSLRSVPSFENGARMPTRKSPFGERKMVNGNAKLSHQSSKFSAKKEIKHRGGEKPKRGVTPAEQGVCPVDRTKPGRIVWERQQSLK